MPEALRHIWLCADDYGISRGVNSAIRDLIMRGRLNAASVMVLAPHFDRGDARSLQMLNAGAKRAALGLHLTLTAPFEPVSESFTPKREGRFLPMKAMQLSALARRLNPGALKLEIAAQIHAFAGAFGHLPDFIDGHQHIHLFPQVRDALLEVMAEATPNAWARQCGRARAAKRSCATTRRSPSTCLASAFASKAQQASASPPTRPSPAAIIFPNARCLLKSSRVFSKGCPMAG